MSETQHLIFSVHLRCLVIFSTFAVSVAPSVSDLLRVENVEVQVRFYHDGVLLCDLWARETGGLFT